MSLKLLIAAALFVLPSCGQESSSLTPGSVHSVFGDIGDEGLFPDGAVGNMDFSYAPHFDNAIAALREVERRRAGFLELVGLQVFDKYQAKIDRFLATGDKNVLLDRSNDPDLEVLNGHRGTVTQEGFLKIYEEVARLNTTRRPNNKIKIVAFDRAPDSTLTYKQWEASHSAVDVREWRLKRDEQMYATLEDDMAAAVRRTKFSVVFAEILHVVKAGDIKFFFPQSPGTPPETLQVTPLASRLDKKFEDLIVIYQNNPADTCVDKIEAQLISRNTREPTNIELKNSPYGDVQNFHCEKELGNLLYYYVPNPYRAKEHYDNYAFNPKAARR